MCTFSGPSVIMISYLKINALFLFLKNCEVKIVSSLKTQNYCMNMFLFLFFVFHLQYFNPSKTMPLVSLNKKHTRSVRKHAMCYVFFVFEHLQFLEDF